MAMSPESERGLAARIIQDAESRESWVSHWVPIQGGRHSTRPKPQPELLRLELSLPPFVLLLL